MRIINTVRKSKSRNFSVSGLRSQASGLNFFRPETCGLRHAADCCIIFLFALCILNLITGCIQKNELELARECVGKSGVYYQHAAERYKKLIAKGNDLEGLRFELGRLYYEHGDFEQAQEELKKTNLISARKLLAISYYRLGNFTDALEIFNQQEISDGEYLYYHGLTCEKLNLFDQALGIYKKIKDTEFRLKAQKRIETIEKQVNLNHIKDIDPEVHRILLNAPSPELYPQAGALILSCDEKIEVTPQGKQVNYIHYIIKILNERGKDDFSETHIEYDSTYEKVELDYARTIKPDGTVVEIGSRHIRDVSKYLNFPLYSNVRVCIISFPEITEGATIEYKLKVYRSQLLNKKDCVLSYSVQEDEPIIAANFNLSLPKDKPLHIKILNEKYNNFGASLNPDIKEKDGYLIYSWQFRDIPQIIPESNMPPHVQINPTILISTFDNWQDIYNWWWNLAKDKISADSAIKDKVIQLTKGLNSLEAKARAIYNFCAQDIRYVAVEYGQAGYEPHSAADIFKNKYGDCKDQAILLVTMLKEAGLLAWPVLIATKERYNLNTDFPAVLFNHCIAAASLEDRVVFLDPTAQTCSFGDLPTGGQGRKVLVFTEEGYKIQDTPLYPAEHNLARQNLKIKLNYDETINGERDIFTYGVYDQSQRYWLLYTPPELIGDALKEKIQEISIGSTLDKYSIKNLDNLNEPVVLSYTFKGPEYTTSAGNLRIMPQLAVTNTSMVAKDKRKYPIDFDILESKEIIFEIEIPQNFVIKYMPDNVNQDSQWLKFIVEYSYKNNKIYFRQKTELKKTAVSEEEYPGFKKFLESLAKQIKQRIVLEKISEGIRQ